LAVNTPKRARRSAVTAIEAAAAAATTALVAALGYSALQTYAARAQVAEAISAATGIAPYVARAYERTRNVPSDDELAPAGDLVATSLPFVASISVTGGRIDVIFAPDAHAGIAGKRISLTPYESASLDLVWRCGNSRPGPGLEPLGFASGGRQAIPLRSTIEARYLPSDCR
jgi:hypothetical protein